MDVKRFAKAIVVSLLGLQVRRLLRRHPVKVVAVVGSIGKTSTKLAIAQMLQQRYKVQFQNGNYNDIVTVPLVFFGEELPNLLNPVSWIKLLLRNERQIRGAYDHDVVVLELGTDTPGDIQAFKRYLKVDIAVVTAIAPEHMQSFKDLDDVAKEELSVIQYSSAVLVNADLVADEYVSLVPEAITYGIEKSADYHVDEYQFTPDGALFTITKEGTSLLNASHPLVSEAQLYSLLAGTTVCNSMGMSVGDIKDAFVRVKAVSGRLQLLKGINGSTIIDDTYNASPEAVKLALTALYRMDSPQRIALLGSMNELGDFSEQAHRDIGAMCDPGQLTELITLGPDANEFLAPEAERAGCKVTRCTTPYEAGEYLRSIITSKATVLAKGSQNQVFAEEAIKSILANSADEQKLVRQSPEWIAKKSKSFQSA